jgi:hypothetical protein
MRPTAEHNWSFIKGKYFSMYYPCREHTSQTRAVTILDWNESSSWANPPLAPPMITNIEINNHTDGQHWIRYAYALPVRKLFDYIKG